MAADSVTPWRWYWMCVAGWTMMVGAWMAAGDVMGMPEFLLGCAVVLVASFPISYYAALGPAALRSVTNLIAVSGALAFGLLGLPHIWLPLFNEAGASLGAAYRLLIALFTWVMVWRAAALREPSDVLQTTLPVGSVLLLALVSDPGVLTAAGACVALLGTMATMAMIHEAHWAPTAGRVRALVGQRAPRARSANSWPTVYVVALMAALAASQSVHSFDLTTVIGRYVQIRLARLVASWMIRQPVQHVSHEPRLTLYTPAPASNQPLFEVSTDGPDSWRMTTYETYQHGIWSRKYGRTHRARKIGQFIALPVVAGSGVSDRGERVRMEVTARVPMAGAIPSLLWPRFLQAPDRMDEKNFHIDATGTVISSRYFRPGDRYTIIAVDPRGWPGQLDKKLRAACLQLPPDLPPRVKKLAWQIAGKSTAPSARVSALATYLRDNYTYDPFPPLPPRRQGDPTDYFLFVSKRGYCAHFASALALMCRAIGYPARVVSGFLGTEFVGGARDKSGAYLVRAKDAHAWVEVYLPGEGWVSFDPTPPRPPGPSEVAAQAWDRMTTAVSRAIGSAGRWAAGHIAEAAALVGLCVLGAVARRYRRWADVTSVSTPPGLSPTQQIVHLYRQMLRWLELYDGFPP